jgi:hypothetical protein
VRSICPCATDHIDAQACPLGVNRDRSGWPHSPIDVRFPPKATEITRHCNMSRRANRRHLCWTGSNGKNTRRQLQFSLLILVLYLKKIPETKFRIP